MFSSSGVFNPARETIFWTVLFERNKGAAFITCACNCYQLFGTSKDVKTF